MLTRNPRITAAGLALFTNQAPGFSVSVTHVALGAAVYDPTGTETALKSEFARFPIATGADISPSQIQVGALVKNTDPQARSTSNKYVGEIGFYVGATLLAVMSQSDRALFYKSPDLDVPISYILDFSTLPPGSLTVGAASLSDDLRLASATAQANGAAAVAAAATIKASYYGSFDYAPATRPNGSPRQKGDRYFDTVSNAEKTWNGVAWYIPNIGASDLAAPTGAGLVGFAQRNVAAKLGDILSLADYPSVAAAVTAATGKCLLVGASESITLQIPTQFASIPAALAAISSWIINGTVTLKSDDGTYSSPSSIYINHPFGARIRIIGNVATPGNCILQCPSSDGFYLPPGAQIGEIDGFRVVKTGAKANLGILTDGGKVLKLGPNIEVDNFYYGIAARNGGYVNAGGFQDAQGVQHGVKVTNAGDVGIWAFNNSYVNCTYSDVSTADDSVHGLGGGIVAEFSSNIQANNAKVHGNWLVGMSCLSSSSIRAWSSVSDGNQHGFIASSNGTIEIFNSKITNNTVFGYKATNGGHIFGWTTCTQSGNDAYNGYAVCNDLELAEDGQYITNNTGTLRLAGNGPMSATGGDSYLDMEFAANKYGIIRAMKSTGVPGSYTEMGRIQFNGVANQWEFANNGTKLKVTTAGTVAINSFQCDGGTGDSYIDCLAATGHYAIHRYLINNVEVMRHQYDGVNSAWLLGGNGKTFIRAFPATGKMTVGVGAPAANATSGHLQIPAQAGAPTGAVADVQAGFAPIVFDTTNNKIWVYTGTGWKGAALA